MNKKLIIASSLMAVMPIVALAQINPGNPPFQQNISIVGLLNTILGILWPIFFGFAVIMFIWAGFLFLTSRGEAEKAGEARQAVMWGIVGVVVGIIAFSLPLIIRNSLGM